MPHNELARNLLEQEPGRELSHANATCLPNIAPLPISRKPGDQENSNSDTQETSDTYHGELLRHGRHRVIICNGNIQWIIQFNRRADGSVSGPRWAAIAYITTRDALISRWHMETGAHAPELLALPATFRSAGVMA